jgi:cytochrome c
VSRALRYRLKNSAATPFALQVVGACAVLVASICLGTGSGHAQDATKGKAAFVRQCAICHTIDKGGPNGFGPNLFGIVGRKAATVPEYNYSRAFQTAANWVWEEGLLRPWISLPATMVPGNKMAVFQGVAERDRDDIVAYVAAQK